MQPQKLLVIVPYRDRAEHLAEFIPYIKTTLTAQQIPHEIALVEQGPGKLFNRGLLCNAGFVARGDTADYVCFHDIDIIGENFDYTYTDHVTHLSAREQRRNYEEWYPECIGGVTLFARDAFTAVNGFSNEYFGWGCEDDDLRLRCQSFGVPVTRRQGRYRTLEHPTMPHADRAQHSPNYRNNATRLQTFRAIPTEARKKITKRDGLTTVKAKIQTIHTTINANYTLVSVTI